MDEFFNIISNGVIYALILENYTGIGLSMDIFGVLVIYICTSTKRIEAEIVYRAMRDITDNIEELGESYSFQEHERRLSNSYDSVRRNRTFAKFGLILIVVGFTFQLIGTYVQNNGGL